MKRKILLLILIFLNGILLHAQSWTLLPGANGHAMTSDPSGNIYASIFNGGYSSVARWNGSSWSKLGTDADALKVYSLTIYSICSDPSGNIYAVGNPDKTIVNGQEIYSFNVFKWNGSKWTQLGALNANSTIYTICSDPSGNIYAAGWFTNASGKYYVAKWDGTSWSELGTGTNALNANLMVYNVTADALGNIYAAGAFKNDSGNPYVAKWNGTSWTELGTGTNALNANHSILSILPDASGNIYAAGYFNDNPLGYNDANFNIYVAKWNGTSWSKLGNIKNLLNGDYNYIRSLCFDPSGNIYAGGRLTNASGNYFVAKWNGISWSDVGTAIQLTNYDDLYSICSDPSGNIYVGGDYVAVLRNGANQTITFNTLPAKTVGDPSFNLTATASSGLPVTYTSSNTSVATISGNTVLIVGAGTTNITASQAGNSSYNPAPNVVQPLLVNPSAPSYVKSPANNAVNVNPNISLVANTVTGATTYTIEANTASDFSGTSIVKIGSAPTINFAGSLAYGTTYYTRVKTNLSGAWGPTYRFITASSQYFTYAYSPANNALNVNPNVTITANIIIGATSYTIEANTASDFSGTPIVKTSTTPGINFSGSLNYGTTYYVRVMTNLPGSTWGATTKFTTSTVTNLCYVTSPATNASNINPVLNITANKIIGATSYTIEVNTASDFTGTSVEKTGNSPTINFTGSLAYNTIYYTRVKTDLSGGVWGPTTKFTTGSVTSLCNVASPVNTASNVNPILTIAANTIIGATSYTIEVNTASDFTGTSVEKTGSSATINFTGSLAYNTTYYTRVKTDLSGGVWGPTTKFTTGSVPYFSYVASPATNATGVIINPTIVANLIAGATMYTIELNTASDFSGTPFVKTSSSRSIAFSGLANGQTYYTRVMTDISGGVWGATRKFTTVTSAARIGFENDMIANGEFRAYPNPFDENFNVSFISPAEGKTIVELYNLQGRLVKVLFEGELLLNEPKEILVDGRELTEQVYMIRLTNPQEVKVIRVMTLK